MKNITLEEVIQTYGVENWGAGYFEVNRKGHLAVRPAEGDPRSVDVKELVDDLVDVRRVQLPILLRFPQILTNQLKKVQRSFQDASREFGYSGRHYGVFPMKVNPRREVVEEFLREGSKYNFGVECGSKAELYAALSLDQTPESLLVCNGFKDEAFINLALLGVQSREARHYRCRKAQRAQDDHPPVARDWRSSRHRYPRKAVLEGFRKVGFLGWRVGEVWTDAFRDARMHPAAPRISDDSIC